MLRTSVLSWRMGVGILYFQKPIAEGLGQLEAIGWVFKYDRSSPS